MKKKKFSLKRVRGGKARGGWRYTRNEAIIRETKGKVLKDRAKGSVLYTQTRNIVIKRDTMRTE